MRTPEIALGRVVRTFYLALVLHGAEGQNRTADTVIFSHVLYQLSYLGTQSTLDYTMQRGIGDHATRHWRPHKQA
jgi:hypothetical protein